MFPSFAFVALYQYILIHNVPQRIINLRRGVGTEITFRIGLQYRGPENVLIQFRRETEFIF